MPFKKVENHDYDLNSKLLVNIMVGFILATLAVTAYSLSLEHYTYVIGG
jgi:hypothetical protein